MAGRLGWGVEITRVVVGLRGGGIAMLRGSEVARMQEEGEGRVKGHERGGNARVKRERGEEETTYPDPM